MQAFCSSHISLYRDTSVQSRVSGTDSISNLQNKNTQEENEMKNNFPYKRGTLLLDKLDHMFMLLLEDAYNAYSSVKVLFVYKNGSAHITTTPTWDFDFDIWNKTFKK